MNIFGNRLPALDRKYDFYAGVDITVRPQSRMDSLGPKLILHMMSCGYIICAGGITHLENEKSLGVMCKI